MIYINYKTLGEKDMFLHIGADTEVIKKDIIAVIDVKAVNTSDITKEFLKKAYDEGMVVEIAHRPKSLVVVENGDKDIIYLSPISPVTLQKRAECIMQSDFIV